MTQYLFLGSLLFNLSWVCALMWLQVNRGAHKHYIFTVEVCTLLMLVYETYREWLVLTWQLESDVSAVRVFIYGVEHLLLGIVLREAFYYVELCKKARKHRRRIS